MKHIHLCAAVLCAGLAHAEVADIAPAAACNYLAHIGLRTTTYMRQAGGEYQCVSPHVNIGMVNNIAYLVTGSEHATREIRLVIEVDQPDEAAAIHRRLKDVANALAAKLGLELPDPILQGITTGHGARAAVASRNISVIRTDRPAARGYELRVSFE